MIDLVLGYLFAQWSVPWAVGLLGFALLALNGLQVLEVLVEKARDVLRTWRGTNVEADLKREGEALLRSYEELAGCLAKRSLQVDNLEQAYALLMKTHQDYATAMSKAWTRSQETLQKLVESSSVDACDKLRTALWTLWRDPALFDVELSKLSEPTREALKVAAPELLELVFEPTPHGAVVTRQVGRA